ncbi:MAG: DUF5691 domain-containing protein [Paenirhodobacter sp.]|uniref:DUF5691 domain-containing protein n=1 Tax=Paenirhodobacter sp. TaxID=1965326 RepID=UPI003D0C7280
MAEILAQLAEIKARWMTGTPAAPACPEAWRAALGEAPELALLALAGAFGQVATRPAPPAAVAPRALLPALALPALPEALRPDLRRILAAKPVPAERIVALIAARGHVVSPLDWMPEAGATGLPEVYAPWLDWLAERPAPSAGEPSAETWEEFSPQARIAHVEALRRRDPEAGRALIAAVAPGLAAEPRARLIGLLATGLCAADLPFLATLKADRSAKVQSLAQGLRARLGETETDAEARAELAAFFELTKVGLLSRRHLLRARPLKTAAQRRRRAELAEQIALAPLAEGLGLSAAALIAAWDFGDGSPEITAIVARSGSDAEVEALLERLLAAPEAKADPSALIARLGPGPRAALAPRLAQRDGSGFGLTAAMLAPLPGTLDFDTIRRAPAFATLLATFQAEVGGATPATAVSAAQGLAHLGLIADRAAAHALIDQFTRAGLGLADPRLALLRLNAAL